MTDDFDDNSDRTILRPTPGGRGAAAPPPRPPARPAHGDPAREPPVLAQIQTQIQARTPTASAAPDGGGGVGGPVVRAATAVLMAASNLRTLVTAPDVEALRTLMVEEVRRFESRLRTLGLPNDHARHAHYAVCATVDDFVLNTPWGRNSMWAKHGMAGTFHRETVGGERFFDNLNQLKSDPGRNADVLELIYMCLSLGFQGHMRILPQGAGEIARLREDLHRLLRRGDAAAELSPHWRGVREPPRRLAAIVPPWVIGAFTGVLLLLAYVGFSFALNGVSDALFGRFAALPQRGVVLIARPPLPPPPVPVVLQQAPRMAKFLEREIAEGLVTVTETMDSVLVRVRNRGLFASGSATVEPPFLPTLQRIAQALEGEKGKVTVIGHTDRQPIRSVRFPSNWHLSVARADAVGALLAKALSDPGRIKTVGKADTDPVADNGTPDGREQNRRIDVVLAKGDGP